MRPQLLVYGFHSGKTKLDSLTMFWIFLPHRKWVGKKREWSQRAAYSRLNNKQSNFETVVQISDHSLIKTVSCNLVCEEICCCSATPVLLRFSQQRRMQRQKNKNIQAVAVSALTTDRNGEDGRDYREGEVRHCLMSQSINARDEINLLCQFLLKLPWPLLYYNNEVNIFVSFSATYLEKQIHGH